MQAVNSLTIQEYTEILADNHGELNSLQECLTITYSEFFRSPLIFALLEQVVFPKIITRKEKSGLSHIRIWSAGCASGQEPFSLAILLSDLLIKRSYRINWNIFATDISENELKFAMKGEYSSASLENLRKRHLDNYFSAHGNMYLINKGIREHINFSPHNLLDGESISPPQSIFGDFDIIVCCNVLLYYKDDIQRAIVDKFYKSLTDQGYLIVGDEETGLFRLNNNFAPAFSASSIYIKR
jgi:chemotaxis methyl-accepting protein methylase